MRAGVFWEYEIRRFIGAPRVFPDNREENGVETGPPPHGSSLGGFVSGRVTARGVEMCASSFSVAISRGWCKRRALIKSDTRFDRARRGLAIAFNW